VTPTSSGDVEDATRWAVFVAASIKSNFLSGQAVRLEREEVELAAIRASLRIQGI
jgi:hypothetical protein